jgi:hypothetical protein
MAHRLSQTRLIIVENSGESSIHSSLLTELLPEYEILFLHVQPTVG